MKVKCIKPVVMEDRGVEVTTVGKIYTSYRKKEKTFSIIDDEKEEHWFDNFGLEDYDKQCHTEDHFVKVCDIKEKEILNCPFCGSRPYMPTNIKKNKSITSCANNKCEIFGVSMQVNKWNKRQ